jgi:hypothetical protein
LSFFKLKAPVKMDSQWAQSECAVAGTSVAKSSCVATIVGRLSPSQGEDWVGKGSRFHYKDL